MYNKTKIFLIYGSLCSMIFIILSCSRYNENFYMEDINGEISQLDILDELKAYNDRLPSMPYGRGLSWVSWLSIVIADGKGGYEGAKIGMRIGAHLGPKGLIIGGCFGGTIIGAVASFSQYQMAKDISGFSPYVVEPFLIIDKRDMTASYVLVKDSVSATDYNLGLSYGVDTCIIQTAVHHNKILDNVERIHTSGNQHILIEGLDAIEYQIYEDTEFNYYYNKLSLSPLGNNLESDENLLGTSDSIMNLFIMAVNKSCTNQEELNEIISYYTYIVKKSKVLSEEDKDCLYTGFAVTGYSFQYWTNKFPFGA